MKVKYLFSALAGLALSVSAIAQNNPGVDFMTMGETDMAKNYFMRTMRQTPAESFYYLGQIALEGGNLAEAKKSFSDGLNSNPESALCAVGLAKLDLKANPKEATKELENIKKQNKKNVVVLIEIARAFHENGMADKADKLVAEAKKVDKNSPLPYIFDGQRYEKAKDAGKAAAEYDQAKYFDSKCTLAYIKGAQVYEGINNQLAIELLKQAIEIQPDYTVASRYLAKLYYDNGFYPEAINTYNTIFAAGNYTIDELTGYAASKYFTNDYTGALELTKKGLSEEPKHRVLNRLAMYSSNALGQFAEGAKIAETFFTLPVDTAGYLAEDHMTYGKILLSLDEADKAATEFAKAPKAKQGSVELLKEAVSLFADKELYVLAGDFYSKYNELNADKVEAFDYLFAGRYYYFAGTKLAGNEEAAEELAELMKKADAQLAIVVEKVPDNYQGYMWRGRCEALLDPEIKNALAEPHYAKVAELLSANEEDKTEKVKELTEALKYLSFANYLKFEAEKGAEKAEYKEKASKYCGMYLEIQPEDATISQIYEIVK